MSPEDATAKDRPDTAGPNQARDVAAQHAAARPESSDTALDGAGVRLRETALDGVRYALVSHHDAVWRVGSLTPLWREEAAGLGADPDARLVAELESRGVWLVPDAAAAPPLAVMCCGLGAVWPGMGRELYDNFPAARAGMDRVAALAGWDVLGLMDETDPERIALTRWQIPYLFLLEYAQWSQLASLGLAPALFCGHSLGELIALCLAGVYGLREAWYILDTRAEHMSELEATARRDTGMMAVHAEGPVIDEVLAAWPGLYVSNRNTPRQFILSGPRPALMEARKALRRRRVPAMMLNMSLAFHNPGMRILRDLSRRRLNALEMRPAATPMLSCVTTGFYPREKADICRFITDLDENTVAWTGSVDAMWRRDGIRHFLEIGPQDTLCGLVADCEPAALCLSAGRKGHETGAMRRACARLFALGHLPYAAVSAQRRERQAAGGTAPCAGDAGAAGPPAQPGGPTDAVAPGAAEDAGVWAASGGRTAVILELLARACGQPVAALRPELDLRYDLALRSSRFPLLVQEAGERLGVRVNFEDLLRVSTVGDLVRVLSGEALAAGSGSVPAAGVPAQAGAVAAHSRGPLPALYRLVWRPASPQCDGARNGAAGGAAGGAGFFPEALDPAGTGLRPGRGGVHALCVLDARLLPALWTTLAPLTEAVLAVPEALAKACGPLAAESGCRLRVLHLPPPAPENAARAGTPGPDAALPPGGRVTAGDLVAALDALLAAEGRVDGIFFAPPATELTRDTDAAQPAERDAAPDEALTALAAVGQWARAHGAWLTCLRRWRTRPALARAALEGGLGFAGAWRAWTDAADAAGAVCAPGFLDDGRPTGLDGLGDSLAAELMLGGGGRVLWVRELPRLPRGTAIAARVDRPELFAPVFVESLPASGGESGRADGCGGDDARHVAPEAVADRPALPGDELGLFRAGCQFSLFAPRYLRYLGPCAAGARRPQSLPVSAALGALARGARLCLPWLVVTGFSDVRFFAPLALLPGITRECRLRARPRPWLRHDGRMTRMCRVSLDALELSANGRRKDTAAPVADGMALLARGPVPALAPLPPLARSPETVPSDNLPPDALPPLPLDALYATPGLSPACHLVRRLAPLPATAPPACEAPVSHSGPDVAAAHAGELAPLPDPIADSADWRYTALLHMVEGSVQAACLVLAHESPAAPWRCAGMGYVRFGSVPDAPGTGRPSHGPALCLELRRTWSEERLARFDAQVRDADGTVLLILHHLEFERQDAAPTHD